MYPWLWVWSPIIHFPFSGSVAQNYEPDTTWFSNLIKPSAGSAEIEEKAFNVASYGTQLGLITNILLQTVKDKQNLPEATKNSIKELSEINGKIQKIKAASKSKAHKMLIDDFVRLKTSGGAEFDTMAEELQKLLQQ